MFEDDYENESDIGQAGLSEQTQRQLAKEQCLIEYLETDAAEHPFEEEAEEKAPERKNLRRELQVEKQQPVTLLEKEFLRECRLTVDNGTKKQYNR